MCGRCKLSGRRLWQRMVRTSDVSGASRQLVAAELVDARLDAVLHSLTNTTSNCGVAPGGDHCGPGWERGNANHGRTRKGRNGEQDFAEEMSIVAGDITIALVNLL